MGRDRATFQRLAEDRLAEARVLAGAGHHSGAYYLAGYAIECALKARIAGRFKADEIPDRKLVEAAYTHNLAELLRLSGLADELASAMQVDPALRRRWSVLLRWSEQARYEAWPQAVASDMLDAVDGDEGALFRWLISR